MCCVRTPNHQQVHRCYASKALRMLTIKRHSGGSASCHGSDAAASQTTGLFASVRYNGTLGIGGTSQVPASVHRNDGRYDGSQSVPNQTIQSPGVASSSLTMVLPLLGCHYRVPYHPIISAGIGQIPRFPVPLNRSITNDSHIRPTRIS